MDHYNQIALIKSKLFGPPDEMINDNQTQRSHREYMDKELEYVKTKTGYFSGRAGPGRNSSVEIPQRKWKNLVFNNVRFERLDLVESIELEIGGCQFDKICNENNSFETLQKIYRITDPKIIPIGSLVGNYWLPILSFHHIKLYFRFKKFDEEVEFGGKEFDYEITYEVYHVDDIMKYQDTYPGTPAVGFPKTKSDINWPLTLNFIAPVVQYTGEEYIPGNSISSKIKLGFYGLTTHFIFSIDPLCDVNGFEFVFKKDGNPDSFKLAWSKDNTDNNNITVNKIGNYWVVPLTPNFDLHNLQNYGINQWGDSITQFNIWYDNVNSTGKNIYILAISAIRFVIFNGLAAHFMS